MSFSTFFNRISTAKVKTDEERNLSMKRTRIASYIMNAALSVFVVGSCIVAHRIYGDAGPSERDITDLIDLLTIGILAGQVGLMLLLFGMDKSPRLKISLTIMATLFFVGGIFGLFNFADKLLVRIARIETFMSGYSSSRNILTLGTQRLQGFEAKASNEAMAPLISALVRNGEDPATAEDRAKELLDNRLVKR